MLLEVQSLIRQVVQRSYANNRNASFAGEYAPPLKHRQRPGNVGFRLNNFVEIF